MNAEKEFIKLAPKYSAQMDKMITALKMIEENEQEHLTGKLISKYEKEKLKTEKLSKKLNELIEKIQKSN
jgi:hypothetical protein